MTECLVECSQETKTVGTAAARGTCGLKALKPEKQFDSFTHRIKDRLSS